MSTTKNGGIARAQANFCLAFVKEALDAVLANGDTADRFAAAKFRREKRIRSATAASYPIRCSPHSAGSDGSAPPESKQIFRSRLPPLLPQKAPRPTPLSAGQPKLELRRNSGPAHFPARLPENVLPRCFQFPNRPMHGTSFQPGSRMNCRNRSGRMILFRSTCRSVRRCGSAPRRQTSQL